MPRSTRLFLEVELCRVSPLSWGHLIPFPMLRILLGPLRRKKICPILFLSLLTLPLLSLSSYYYNKNVLPLMILRLLIVSLLILCGLLSSHKVLSMGTVIALIEIIFLETSSATALHTLWWLVTTTLQLTELAYLQIMIIHRMESHDPTKNLLLLLLSSA